jgi:hypothetical protein
MNLTSSSRALAIVPMDAAAAARRRSAITRVLNATSRKRM